MKYRSVLAAVAAMLCVGTSCTDSSIPQEMVDNFRQIPENQRMAVYWYWMSDNISCEGVVKDLEAMKAKGITRAYIGNIWQDAIEAGSVPVFSDGWYDVLHAALKRASELDMEIGLFNCPGWSQSGGPWVKPEQSMRYLDSQTIRVESTGQPIQLPFLPERGTQERLLAYPDQSGQFYSQTVEIDRPTSETWPKDISLDAAFTLRSLSFSAPERMLADCAIQVPDGAGFRTVKLIHLDRTNFDVNVGFRPHAEICVALPDLQTQQVRLEFHGGIPFHCQVTLSDEPRIERFEEKSLGKMFQTPLPMWGEYMWETQPEPQGASLVQAEQVLDLTDKVEGDGTIVLPDGKWVVMRTYMRSTGVMNSPAAPYATGLEVDKMSRQHVASHFDAFLGEVLRRIPAEDRTSFRVVVEDSYEMGSQNWTDDMIEKFQERYGYDPVPFIPTLYGQVIGSQDQSERFLWDLRRLVADRIAYDYVGGLRDVSHEHNLTTWLECYGHWGFPSEFLMYGGQSDEVGGEFWSEGSLGDIENRAASSCAHIYGKQKVWAESCTSGGPIYSRYPYVMKQRTDRFFCEGINSTLLHLYIQQPDDVKYPGISAWFGNEFNRKNVWWEDMDLFTDYLRRCNYMLQQGRYVADVAYFIGEDAPKMTGECNPALPRGYSFDYINAEVLLTKSTVSKGMLQLEGGMQYRVLVLPKQKTMRPEVLEKIAEFTRQGLVVLGPQPETSPSLQGYPEADSRVKALAQEMWGAPTYGQGRVYPDGTGLQTVLDETQVLPDCYVDPAKPVVFLHRTMPGADSYFLSNQSEETISFEAAFRVTGMVPQLWNPVDGEQRPLPQFEDNGSTTLVPMTLLPNQSAFVVFGKGKAVSSDKANFPEATVLATVETPWTVSFQSEMRGPSEPQTFEQLVDWTTSLDEAIRYYSGKATYTNTLSLASLPAEPVYLDLGRVMVMARVYVNDEYAGGAWTYPYQVNVTPFLREGDNTLRVEVVNNWMNRLIGDEQLPVEQRCTWTSCNPWKADSELQTSGLLGPVQLKTY